MNRNLPIIAAFAIALGGGSAALAHGDDEDEQTAAIGVAGDPSHVDRTVEIVMSDAMRFDPSQVQARQGETIRFAVKNAGQLRHEFVLGTEHALEAHYALMKKFPEMEHSDPNMVTVQPGQTGKVVWRFTRPGPVAFACLEPSHYDAGMKGVVFVAADGAVATGAVAAGEGAASRPSPVAGADAMTEGEVRKIDRAAGKITLRHGELRNLDMPAMTMVFRVEDRALLDTLKPGDKVRFVAERANGALVVTRIEAAR
jgi:uncharacterized cupredoxin-like copper-binding protein/Cu/Ag efflux protein CusF